MSNSPITIIGNLTADPDLRYTPGGTARLPFSLAVERRYNKDGEWVSDTSFIRAVAWGRLAEDAARILQKGARTIVVGRLDQRTYEVEGEKRESIEVVADEVGIAAWSIESFVRKTGASAGAARGNGSRSVPEEDPW